MQSLREVVSFPKTTLCGHPKEEIQGAQNQSLATRVGAGFLGNLGEVSTARLLTSPKEPRARFAGFTSTNCPTMSGGLPFHS